MAMTPLTGMPDRSQSQSTFDTNASSFFSTKLPLFVTEANALQVDVDAKKTLAEASATTATTQAGIATTQAGIATTQATLAQDWATQLGTPVSGGEYSAKYHAQGAAASAASAVNSPGTQATSTTSMAVGTGSKSFTLTQTGKAFVVGQWVSIADASAPATNWMTGAITAFTAGTGAITVDVSFSSGSGTIASWVVTQATATNSMPSSTGNEGKILAVNSSAVTAWITPSAAWASWSLIATNGGTFTVPDGVSQIRAYAFGKGGNGAANGTGGAGGAGGSCAFGTIPCKPGDVFTFTNTSGIATLSKGATAYLTAPAGGNASGTTAGAPGGAGTIGSGLGITSSGGYAGGAGCVGGLGANGGGGGSSGSPIGTGIAAVSSSGAGWGAAGSSGNGGGGVAADPTTYHLGGPAPLSNGYPTSRDWTNAFSDPLLRFCNGVAAPWSSAVASSSNVAGPAPAGCGGDVARGAAGIRPGGSGGLGGGGGAGSGTNAAGGNGGFGGGGAYGTGSAAGGSSLLGGGGGGTVSGAVGTSTAGVIIFY